MLEVEINSESTSRWRIMKADSRSAIGRLIPLVIIIGVCVLGFGCETTNTPNEPTHDDGETTWSAEARSPDGLWLATASSRSEGGGPTAYDFTTVDLKWLRGSQPSTRVLGFTQQYPTMNLEMEWVTPKHLNVRYGPSARPGDHVSLDFQVVKMSGIEITVQNLSTETTNTSP
jgi:hypothetical protein